MHGDKYELRVDGMSFSHMYALNRAKGAFGQEGGIQRYDDAYDDQPASYISKPQANDAFGWEKPSSPPKPKPIDHFYGGDGDGWNSVKEAKHEAIRSHEDEKEIQKKPQPKTFFDAIEKKPSQSV